MAIKASVRPATPKERKKREEAKTTPKAAAKPAAKTGPGGKPAVKPVKPPAVVKKTPVAAAKTALGKPATAAKAGAKAAGAKAVGAKAPAKAGKKAAPGAKGKGGKGKKSKEEEEEEKNLAEQDAARKKRAADTQARLKKEADEKAAKAKAEADARAAEMTPDDKGLMHIRIESLQKAIDVVKTSGKTPLVIDPSGRVDTFLGYQACTLIDTKGIFLKTIIHKTQTKEEAVEGLRVKLVNGLKYGHIFHVAMGNGATTMGDYSTPDSFPWEKLLEPGFFTGENTKPVLRKSDYDHNGMFLPKTEEYSVVVTTLFEVADYEEFLAESIPLDKFTPIEVLAPEPK